MFKNHLVKTIYSVSFLALSTAANADTSAAEIDALTVPTPLVHESIAANGGSDTYGFVAPVDAQPVEAAVPVDAQSTEVAPVDEQPAASSASDAYPVEVVAFDQVLQEVASQEPVVVEEVAAEPAPAAAEEPVVAEEAPVAAQVPVIAEADAPHTYTFTFTGTEAEKAAVLAALAEKHIQAAPVAADREGVVLSGTELLETQTSEDMGAFRHTAPATSPFHGWFAALSTGVSYERDNLRVEDLIYVGDGLGGYALKERAGAGLIKAVSPVIRGEAGHQWLMGDFYMSFSLGLEANFIRKQKTLPLQSKTVGHPDSTATFWWHKDSTYAITQRFGYLFQDDMVGYLKLSALNTNFKLSYQQDNINRTKRKNLWGAEVGAGLLMALDDHWNAHVEYGYQIYSAFSNDFDPDIDKAFKGKIIPRFHRLMVGVQYTF